jgi:hypothetical protein
MKLGRPRTHIQVVSSLDPATPSTHPSPQDLSSGLVAMADVAMAFYGSGHNPKPLWQIEAKANQERHDEHEQRRGRHDGERTVRPRSARAWEGVAWRRQLVGLMPLVRAT